MVLYNFTNVTAANSTIDQLIAINSLSSGWFAILAVISLFAIIFIIQSYYSFSGAFLSASFIVTTLTGILWLSGLMPLLVFMVMLPMPLFGVLLVIFTKST